MGDGGDGGDWGGAVVFRRGFVAERGCALIGRVQRGGCGRFAVGGFEGLLGFGSGVFAAVFAGRVTGREVLVGVVKWIGGFGIIGR